MFIIIREHEWKQEVEYLFLQRFLIKADLSLYHFFVQWASTHARSWEKVNFSSSTQRKSAQRQSFTSFTVSQVFSCVFCERNENREKMKFIVGVCQVRKAGKQRHTHFSSIFAQMQRRSMATNDGCSFCVVTLSQCWLQRY